jgi:tetratricopeptide (TPR) repeat protein
MAYRNESLLIKHGWRILTIALLFPNLSQAIELKGVMQLNRLTVAESPLPSEVSVSKGSICGPLTQELKLSYKQATAPMAKSLATRVEVENPAIKLCEKRALHDADGTFHLYFAYKVPKGKVLTIQKSEANGRLIVDHWIDLAPKKIKNARVPASRAKNNNHVIGKIENLNDLSKIETVELRSFTNYESPYRDEKVEKNSVLRKTPLKNRAIEIPILEFKTASTEVEFVPQEFPYKEFLLASHKTSPALKEAIDAIVEMARREDWVRASAANEILLKSKLGREYRSLGFFVPALSGHLKIKSSRFEPGKQDNLLFSGGISVWRETLLKQAVGHKHSDPFLDFMYLESLRYLFEQKDHYTGLALIDEAKGIKWSSAVIERSDYLQGLALFALGMRQKAEQSFTKYIQDRKKLNIKDVSDRRLLPSAAFRLGDIEFSRQNYAKALENYERAMDYLSGSSKVNLEGYVYPRSMVSFSHVLFNMAEAHIRMGDYAKALKRLRALISFDIVGTNHGIALYRIGELLHYLGSDNKRVISIFRECAYRHEGYLSGSLCDLRASIMEPQNSNRKFWPRLEAKFSQFENSKLRADRTSISDSDRKMYMSLLKAKFYFERERPLIALAALDKTRNLESSKYLKDWNFEYSGSALLGSMREYLRQGDYQAVIGSYEKRRKTQLLYVERPDLALVAARAYADQGLWAEAKKAFDRATDLKEAIGRSQARPFDFSETEWKYTDAQIYVGLYAEGKATREQAELKLKALNDSHTPSLLLLIGFAQKSSNLILEIKGWARLSELSSLDWLQLKSYSSALLKSSKHTKALREVLETHVGKWFYEKDKTGAKLSQKNDNPGSVLMQRLAEARIRDNATDSGLRVLEFLVRQDSESLDPSTPKEMLLYSMGKVFASKKDYASARRVFDAATTLAPASVWGRLAAAEVRQLASVAPEANAR